MRGKREFVGEWQEKSHNESLYILLLDKVYAMNFVFIVVLFCFACAFVFPAGEFLTTLELIYKSLN